MTQSEASHDAATRIVQTLHDAGHVAYFAGGCVRDAWLGRPPKDFDVATNAPPPRVRELFRNTQAVGAAFGVILVRIGGCAIEVATFRTESNYADGRHPRQVRFATVEEDARRRDFTINGLFFDPIADRVIDFVNGQADLQARLVRAIGEAGDRFAEDHLRLLRAVRFAADLDFAIEPATAAAIAAHASRLPRISPERIAGELRRMLVGPPRQRAWAELWKTGLAPIVWRLVPGVAAVRDAARDAFAALPAHGDDRFGIALAIATMSSAWMGMPADGDVRTLLRSPLADQLVRGVRQAFRISNEEHADFRGTLAGAATLLADEPPTIAKQKRLLANPAQSGGIVLAAALARLGVRSRQTQAIGHSLDVLKLGEVAPPPLLTGDDLAAAGWPPGPKFKHVLDAVYDAQLEGRVASKEQAMELARGVAR